MTFSLPNLAPKQFSLFSNNYQKVSNGASSDIWPRIVAVFARWVGGRLLRGGFKEDGAGQTIVRDRRHKKPFILHFTLGHPACALILWKRSKRNVDNTNRKGVYHKYIQLLESIFGWWQKYACLTFPQCASSRRCIVPPTGCQMRWEYMVEAGTSSFLITTKASCCHQQESANRHHSQYCHQAG